jgi:hypothetical protein
MEKFDLELESSPLHTWRSERMLEVFQWIKEKAATENRSAEPEAQL